METPIRLIRLRATPPMRPIPAALILLLSLAASLTAQSDWTHVQSLAAGTKIRIEVANSKPISGNLQSVSETSITIDPGGGARSIDQPQVSRVSVRTPARRKRSIVIGLSIGAAAGAGLGGAAAAACQNNICGGHGAAEVAGGAAGGGLIGALIGAAVSHGGWREVYRR